MLPQKDLIWRCYLIHLKNLCKVLHKFFRDATQFTGLTHCQSRNKAALSFAFNASLSSVNLARAFARQQGLNLSVGATKVLLHNATMVDRIFAMSGTRPNLRLNYTDFKELLFYGVRAVG